MRKREIVDLRYGAVDWHVKKSDVRMLVSYLNASDLKHKRVYQIVYNGRLRIVTHRHDIVQRKSRDAQKKNI